MGFERSKDERDEMVSRRRNIESYRGYFAGAAERVSAFLQRCERRVQENT